MFLLYSCYVAWNSSFDFLAKIYGLDTVLETRDKNRKKVPGRKTDP